jgi:hypothetical protein
MGYYLIRDKVYLRLKSPDSVQAFVMHIKTVI